jgi:hypothetical protein
VPPNARPRTAREPRRSSPRRPAGCPGPSGSRLLDRRGEPVHIDHRRLDRQEVAGRAGHDDLRPGRRECPAQLGHQRPDPGLVGQRRRVTPHRRRQLRRRHHPPRSSSRTASNDRCFPLSATGSDPIRTSTGPGAVLQLILPGHPGIFPLRG